MEILDVLREVAIDALLILLPVVAGWAAVHVRAFVALQTDRLKSRIGEDNFILISEWIRTFIHAAEQKAGLDSNEAKKAFVLDAIMALVDQYELPFSRQQVDDLIEGILKQIKMENTGAIAQAIQVTARD